MTKSLKTLMNFPNTTSISGKTVPLTIMATKATAFKIHPFRSLYVKTRCKLSGYSHTRVGFKVLTRKNLTLESPFFSAVPGASSIAVPFGES